MKSKLIKIIFIGSCIGVCSSGFADNISQSASNNDEKSLLTFHVPNSDSEAYYLGLEINGKNLPGIEKITNYSNETVEETQSDLEDSLKLGYEKIGNNNYIFYKCNIKTCDKNNSIASFSQQVQIQKEDGVYVISPSEVNITWTSNQE